MICNKIFLGRVFLWKRYLAHLTLTGISNAVFILVLVALQRAVTFFAPPFSFTDLIFQEYGWNPSSLTFSLLVFPKSEEQEKGRDGESKKRPLIFKLKELEEMGTERDRTGGGGEKKREK